MGREQRRKEQFKNKNKKINEEQLDTSINYITIIKLVCFVVILLFVIYYVLAVFVTKEIDITNKETNNETSAVTDDNTDTTVANKILASNIFNQKEEEYYVYFYNFSDENETISSVVSNLEEPVYKVDTNSSLNSKYITEEKGNKNATKIEELKVKDPTIIKISGDKIIEYYEGSTSIINEINN